MATYTVVTSDFINLSITSSRPQTSCIERRFKKGITIEELKGKLELISGGNQLTMKLDVYDKYNKLICSPNEGSRLLGSYPIDDSMRLHVVDAFLPQDDLSMVEKFEISEAEYAKRPDTVKAFLAKNRLGKYNEEEMKKKSEEKQKEDDAEEAVAKSLVCGNRCEVHVPGQPKRRATIMYIGKPGFKEGWWVGVKYDEPLGKNDGWVNGKKFFDCLPKYGSFVKPAFLKQGEFPEEDYNLDDEL